MPNRLAAYDPQLEIFEGDKARVAPRRDEPLGEMQEMAFAAEILELRDERGLEALVGRVVGEVARALGQSRASPPAEAIRRLLTSVLKQSMPRAAAARSRAIIAPIFGDRLAAIPGHSLGLELEGLSEEDRRFETARQLVRFVAGAAKRGLAASQLEPGHAARAAAFAAARHHAPGMMAGRQPGSAVRFGSGFEDRAGSGPFRLRPVTGPAGSEQVPVLAPTIWRVPSGAARRRK